MNTLLPILPQIFLSFMGCVILLMGVFSPHFSISYYLTQAALILTLILCFLSFSMMDPLSFTLKAVILIQVSFVLLYGCEYNAQRHIANPEFVVLVLFATVGMMILVSARDLLMLFLGAELLSLPTYAMVAMRRDKERCLEAALKYFVVGALATGLLLYGFSMLFGATQSLHFSDFAHLTTGSSTLLVLGLVFVLSGLLFKWGAAPFHMWVPDVYEGAPTSVSLWMATAPKVAIFGMAIRLLAEALPGLSSTWQPLLIIAAVASIILGNIAAMVQTHIKRLMAYSAIAHAGYALLGLLAATPRGYIASMFYLITYTFMNLGAWGIIVLMHRAGFEVEQVDDLRGLNNRHPWLAFMMLIFIFSMAGVPPLVGFVAKVGLLEALISVHQTQLAVLAILFSVVGAYYYLRIIKVMYFESSDGHAPLDKVQISRASLIALSVNGLLVLLLGLAPGGLFILCRMAFPIS